MRVGVCVGVLLPARLRVRSDRGQEQQAEGDCEQRPTGLQKAAAPRSRCVLPANCVQLPEATETFERFLESHSSHSSKAILTCSKCRSRFRFTLRACSGLSGASSANVMLTG